jgi:hypothetical protein
MTDTPPTATPRTGRTNVKELHRSQVITLLNLVDKKRLRRPLPEKVNTDSDFTETIRRDRGGSLVGFADTRACSVLSGLPFQSVLLTRASCGAGEVSPWVARPDDILFDVEKMTLRNTRAKSRPKILKHALFVCLIETGTSHTCRGVCPPFGRQTKS